MTNEEIQITVDLARQHFESIGLPFVMAGSMLKGIICQGRPYETDSETDFYVFADDLKKVWDKAKDIPGAFLLDGTLTEFRAFFIDLKLSFHSLVTCGVLYEHELGYYFNVNHNDFVTIPKEGYLPLKKYWFNNKWWDIPGNWPDIFQRLYGDKWQDDYPDHHWQTSGGYISAGSLDELFSKWREREAVINNVR